MANLIDYLHWRGDLSFEKDPFNEVDNLVFAELAYTELDEIFRSEDFHTFIALDELYKRYLPYAENRTQRSNDPFDIFEAAAQSDRYKEVKAGCYINILDNEKDIQFSAITFFLPDNTTVVAYRGTDSTIVGWREDLNFSYMNNAPSQVLAKDYLNYIVKTYKKPVRPVGHSKGGNLAVYASVHADKDVKKRIIEIYNNDGPGFLKPIIESEEYKSMVDRIHGIIPEDSLIGTLMSDLSHPAVVESEQYGPSQHNPKLWKVMGKEFVRARGRSSGSFMMDETLQGWLESCTEDERKAFVDTVFDAIEASGASTVGDIKKSRFKSSTAILKALWRLEPDKRKQMQEVLQKLAKSGGGVVSEELQKTISNISARISAAINKPKESE